MPEEKKLGDSVTYTNPDRGNKLMTVAGVLLKEGESVNLVEKLGESRARPIIDKLAKNRFFKVEGGEDHQQKQQEQPSQTDDEIAQQAVAEEARIRREQGDAKADEYVNSLDASGRKKDQGGGGGESAQRRPPPGEPPPDVKTPETMTLEQPPKRRG
jgi:hypothetical protein